LTASRPPCLSCLALNSPEFAAIKSRLARAYLDHKADIVAPHATDQDILDHVDDITALMLGALGG